MGTLHNSWIATTGFRRIRPDISRLASRYLSSDNGDAPVSEPAGRQTHADAAKQTLPSRSIDSLSLLNMLQSEHVFSETQASAILYTLNEIVKVRFSNTIPLLVTRQRVETDSHMLRARYHEIKLELQTLASKNALARKGMHEKSLDDVQKTLEKLRDSVHHLQAESKLRISVFKSENREENSKIDSAIHQKTGQLTLLMSDIKTNVEAIKVRLMFSFTSFIIVAFFFLIMEKNLKSKTSPSSVS